MVTRVSGFSGMDIDSIVKNMMTAKRVPLDKLNQEKQILQWTRDSYREMNSKLYDFRTNKLVTKYGVNEALNSQKAVVTENTDALKAQAKADANGIDMTVTVKQLATYASLKTDGIGSGKTSALTMGELDTADNALSDADKLLYYKDAYTLSINGENFVDEAGNSLFTNNTSISTMISTINSNTKANAVASFDELTGKLIIRSKVSGTPSLVSGSTDGKVETGSDPSKNKVLSLFNVGSNVTVDGQDAIVKINDTDNLTYKSNVFTVNGIEMTLQKTTFEADGVTHKPVKITTQADPSKVLETIKGFVEDYNSLISLMNSKVDEVKYRDFAPLTDEQKTSMKEGDITAWTEKAKSGLFKNNDILKSVLSEMRSVITEKLGPLSTLGITTGSYTENGKLKVDEEKLKKAINSNPQVVMDLLQGSANATNDGIFDKLADKVTVALDKISVRAGTNKFTADLNSSYKEESIMGKKLKSYNDRIEVMLTNLSNLETRYYKQFSAMETAMNKLTTQSASLFSS